MNTYELHVISYEDYLEQNPDLDENQKKVLQERIKAEAFMSSASEEALLAVFDCGQYNAVLRGYVQMAMDNLKFSDANKKRMQSELYYLFDTCNAACAAEYFWKNRK